ncbi:MAG TPA: hypothetical protein VFJ61_06165 [Solirubrobacterales bacterium]|nr:hypothetical protein [Solirubrobacterales bacterium]
MIFALPSGWSSNQLFNFKQEEEAMTRTEGRRARLGMTWFALALGALALLAMPGVAAAKDRNHDRIPDRWEKRHHLSLKVDQAGHDQDGDHLRNRAEFLSGDDPRDHDSDDDGVADGQEQAGTIASFDATSGRLTIDLFGSDTISGLVNDETEIKCEDHGGASASSDGSEVGDDNSGSGEAEPGDDNGGQVEPGDDNGTHEEAGDDNGGQGEEEPGDDRGGDNSGPSDNSGPGSGDDADGGSTCTTADLVAGAVVQEAELKIAGGQAVFEEVELSGKAV